MRNKNTEPNMMQALKCQDQHAFSNTWQKPS